MAAGLGLAPTEEIPTGLLKAEHGSLESAGPTNLDEAFRTLAELQPEAPGRQPSSQIDPIVDPATPLEEFAADILKTDQGDSITTTPDTREKTRPVGQWFRGEGPLVD